MPPRSTPYDCFDLYSYAEGLIAKAEFEPRIAGLKQQLSQLEERHRAALDAIDVERRS